MVNISKDVDILNLIILEILLLGDIVSTTGVNVLLQAINVKEFFKV